MPQTSTDATDAELAVMQALWDAGAGVTSTIRDLTDRIYPGGAASEYSTVQKLLERLEEKGLVARSAESVPHRFSAIVGRSELVGRRLRSVARKLCGGSMTPLLTHLLTARSLSAREIDELRSLIDRLDRSPAPKKRR
jgi:BlaI family transcriptional regulator, penicillinase repressor